MRAVLHRARGRCIGRLAAAAAIGAFLTVGASEAAATQRFAAPGGSGVACTQAAKCTAEEAVEAASNGDEVILDPGTYTEPDPISATAANLVIHGVAANAKPNLVLAGAPGLTINGLNSEIRNVRITHTATGATGLLLQSVSVAERVEVISAASYACGAVGASATFRDSTCHATSASAVALGVVSNTTSVLSYARNVTAIASGSGSTGIQVGSAAAGLTVELDAGNVIAQGNLADIVALTTSASGDARATMGTSDYVTTLVSGPGTNSITAPGSGSNITAPPVFVDVTTGNFRQQATSPTVNAGAIDSRTGTQDFEGEARPQGAAMDIGADELPDSAPTDTDPPETTIDKGPKKKTKSKKATFTFSADEAGSTFECKLDKGAFGACASPQKYKRLKKGKHVFTVVATDAAGNTDASPTTHKWKVKKKRK